MRNLLSKVPKSASGLVATLVRGIFEQPDADDAVWRMHSEAVEKLEERFVKASALLDRAGADILAFTAFPKAHWRRIWSNNPLERLNKELRRRSDVVGIFPNRAAVIRLLGAVLAEQHDEWVRRPPLPHHRLARRARSREPRSRARKTKGAARYECVEPR